MLTSSDHNVQIQDNIGTVIILGDNSECRTMLYMYTISSFFAFCGPTPVVVGFEQESYIVGEGDGETEICVVVFNGVLGNTLLVDVSLQSGNNAG